MKKSMFIKQQILFSYLLKLWHGNKKEHFEKYQIPDVFDNPLTAPLNSFREAILGECYVPVSKI